jgi:hypothetical protein
VVKNGDMVGNFSETYRKPEEGADRIREGGPALDWGLSDGKTKE